MSQEGGVAPGRRRLHLLAAFCALGTGVGVTKYLADRSLSPAGNATPVDLGDLPVGRLCTVDWNGLTVWILRRSAAELAALADREGELIDPDSAQSIQPVGCRNQHHSLRPEVFVAIGQCTHQGCLPQLSQGRGVHGEFLCPCHTSRFDLAGRVFRPGPALANLVIPEYRLESDAPLRLVIGEV